MSRLRRRAVRRASRDSDRVWGVFVFGAVVAVSPPAMEHVFPVVMFLHCASNADYLCVNAKELGRECRFSTRRRLSSSRWWQSRRLVSTGQWSRLLHGNANLVWHRSCYCSTDSPFGTREGPFPRFPLPPRKPPDSARSHTRCYSDTWFEKASRQHALSRCWKHLRHYPHHGQNSSCRQSRRGRRSVDRHLALNNGERG